MSTEGERMVLTPNLLRISYPRLPSREGQEMWSLPHPTPSPIPRTPSLFWVMNHRWRVEGQTEIPRLFRDSGTQTQKERTSVTFILPLYDLSMAVRDLCRHLERHFVSDGDDGPAWQNQIDCLRLRLSETGFSLGVPHSFVFRRRFPNPTILRPLGLVIGQGSRPKGSVCESDFIYYT